MRSAIPEAEFCKLSPLLVDLLFRFPVRQERERFRDISVRAASLQICERRLMYWEDEILARTPK